MKKPHNNDEFEMILDQLRKDPQFLSSISRTEQRFADAEREDDSIVLSVRVKEGENGGNIIAISSCFPTTLEVITFLSGLIPILASPEKEL